jgi:hypothetical protein
VPKFIADVEGSGFECANRRFQLDKRSQLFIGPHNETLSVAAMCVSKKDRSPARVHG